MGVTLLEFVALFVTVLFLSYVAMILVPFLRRPRTVPGDSTEFEWHFFIPARDEEAVIETTLNRCRADFPEAHVWVIDDASTDRTAEIVHRMSLFDWNIHLVRRELPNARTGKGDALNAAYYALSDWFPSWADRS